MMPSSRVVLIACLALACHFVSGLPPCSFYFGPAINQTNAFITVADPDVFDGYPTGNLTFVHHSGPGSICHVPAPPAGCHRYYVATYNKEGCPNTCDLVNGNAKHFAGHFDTAGHFDRAAGVLKTCFSCLKSVQMHCWSAPVDNPQPCPCPGGPDLLREQQ